jgi:protein-S-isoprenylcysteine O-methyltransferase Ste14
MCSNVNVVPRNIKIFFFCCKHCKLFCVFDVHVLVVTQVRCIKKNCWLVGREKENNVMNDGEFKKSAIPIYFVFFYFFIVCIVLFLFVLFCCFISFYILKFFFSGLVDVAFSSIICYVHKDNVSCVFF